MQYSKRKANLVKCCSVYMYIEDMCMYNGESVSEKEKERKKTCNESI